MRSFHDVKLYYKSTPNSLTRVTAKFKNFPIDIWGQSSNVTSLGENVEKFITLPILALQKVNQNLDLKLDLQLQDLYVYMRVICYVCYISQSQFDYNWLHATFLLKPPVLSYKFDNQMLL